MVACRLQTIFQFIAFIWAIFTFSIFAFFRRGVFCFFCAAVFLNLPLSIWVRCLDSAVSFGFLLSTRWMWVMYVGIVNGIPQSKNQPNKTDWNWNFYLLMLLQYTHMMTEKPMCNEHISTLNVYSSKCYSTFSISISISKVRFHYVMWVPLLEFFILLCWSSTNSFSLQ